MLTVPHHVPRLGHTLRVIVTYLWPTHKLSVAIAFLPPEVLHAIFELLTFSDHNTLSNCMRVCRRWHDIARLRFFAAVPVNYSQIERFHDLLRADPGLAAHVREVRFFDELGQRMYRCFPEFITSSPLHSFDIDLFASTLPVLKLVNLQHLSLTGFDNLNTWHHSLSLSQPPAHGQGTSSLPRSSS